MPAVGVNGGLVAYEILGDGDPIVLTPGGRFSIGIPGLRPLAEALAPHMKVLIWDRPKGRIDCWPQLAPQILEYSRD
jgi:2-hydroxy-6-oxonona-2,4-dienedioate hydrolase